jgi:hypothetical protein
MAELDLTMRVVGFLFIFWPVSESLLVLEIPLARSEAM